MAADISVTRLDVVKEYNSKLKTFRNGALACGVLIDHQIRKIQSEMDYKKQSVKSPLSTAKSDQDRLVNRYKNARSISLPGIEVIGDSDHQIQMKYVALENAVNDYLRTVDTIKAKMAEIGQQTKTFCTILDSETRASNDKLDEMIAHMDEMCNIRL